MTWPRPHAPPSTTRSISPGRARCRSPPKRWNGCLREGVSLVNAPGKRRLTIGRAMQEAMAQEMRQDSRVFLMGEDICRFGGVWGHTAGLVQEFGPERIRDTPI